MNKILHYSPGGEGVICMLESGRTEFVEKNIIAGLFENYGGSFVKALGECLYKADTENTLKILKTWENYSKEYIEKFLVFPNS